MTHGVARYEEIVRFWDINEVAAANERLDIREDIEWFAYLKNKPNKG